jgi:TetR/AcrR family transcriptional regulator
MASKPVEVAPPTTAGRRAARKAQLHELARTQFLDAAEEVFGAKGVHAATIKEIAERAEYSVGSVYLFFENKDDLFTEVLSRRGREMVEGIAGVVPGAGTPMRRMTALARFEAEFFRHRSAFARLVLASSTLGRLMPATTKGREAEQSMGQAMSLTASLIREGQADGTICEGDPLILARLLSGIVSGYQATDPAIVGDSSGSLGADPFSLTALEQFVERAFSRHLGDGV